MTPNIGSVGVWMAPRSWRGMDLRELVAEFEEEGYGAFWMGGTPSLDLREPARLLAATRSITIVTAVVSAASGEPEEVVEPYHRVVASYPERFILGIGAGHGGPKTRPYERLVRFLDVLDTHNVPAERRMLAALGPKVLALAGNRSAGAHPYLVTPEHTRRAREILGTGPLLVPEQKVVLETDPDTARARARGLVSGYLAVPNYVNHLHRLGYTDDDLAGGGSDRLVDDLVAWGDEDAIRTRIGAHLEAGADHVAIQVLNQRNREVHRILAPVLLGVRR